MNYWVAVSGQQYGPFPLAELRRMITEGRVALTDLAWAEGMPAWLPVAEVLPAEAPTYAPMPPPMPAAANAPVTPRFPGMSSAPGMASGGPMPPSLSWGLVLLFSFLTFGIFGIVWVFVEAGFVKKLDPRNNARMLIVVAFILNIASAGVSTTAMFPGTGRTGQAIAAMGLPLSLAAALCVIAALFIMRRSLLQHYNTVEPIQLRLSPVMTFFFNILYFQHHFSRIATWKKTGQMTPQKG